MHDKIEKILVDQLEAFAKALDAHGLSHVPHLVIMFDKNLTEAKMGHTPHLSNRLARVCALMDCARHELRLMAVEHQAVMDQAMLDMLKNTHGPTLIN